jgi:hypothetical protein
MSFASSLSDEHEKPTLAIDKFVKAPEPSLTLSNNLNFSRYVPSGYKVIINTPLLRNNREAIFGINLDGFVMPYRIHEDLPTGNFAWSSINRNMSSVQAFPNASAFVSILQEQIMMPHMTDYFGYRYVTGSVGVGLRITSNTSQSGTMLITHAPMVRRAYYANSTAYTGLRFAQSSYNQTDYAQSNFALVDLSLNRQVGITANRIDPMRTTDMAHKMMGMINIQPITNQATAQAATVFSNQFLEDWLLIGPFTNLPDQNANQLTIDIFYDFSKLQYHVPIYPFINSPPNRPDRTIIDFTKTFNNRFVNISFNKRLTTVWFPSPTKDEEDDSPVRTPIEEYLDGIMLDDSLIKNKNTKRI